MLTALENTLKEKLTDYPSYLAKTSRKASLPGLLTKKPAKSYFREDGEYLELNDFTPDQPRQRYEFIQCSGRNGLPVPIMLLTYILRRQ